jgi:predicted HD phosphohydrolase
MQLTISFCQNILVTERSHMGKERYYADVEKSYFLRLTHSETSENRISLPILRTRVPTFRI